MEVAIEGLARSTPINLEVREIPVKGRGVFSKDQFDTGEYLCEYETAEVYPRKDKKKREAEYAANGEGCYVLEACVEGKWLCFDATRRYNSIGRYINHAATKLATAKLFHPLMVRGKYRVAILAARPIVPGEEITYDYGCEPRGIEWLMKVLPLHKARRSVTYTH